MVIENLIVGILVALSAWVVGKKLRASLGFGPDAQSRGACGSGCGSEQAESLHSEKLISLPSKKKPSS